MHVKLKDLPIPCSRQFFLHCHESGKFVNSGSHGSFGTAGPGNCRSSWLCFMTFCVESYSSPTRCVTEEVVQLIVFVIIYVFIFFFFFCHWYLPLSILSSPGWTVVTHSFQAAPIIIIIIYPLTARVVWAPQMILQPVFSIFPCSPLPSGTCRTPGLSIP